MRSPAQIFVTAKFMTPYRPEFVRSKTTNQMIQIELDSKFETPNGAVQFSEVELELLRMEITSDDLQAICLSESELIAMAPTIEDVMAMTDADWARLRLSQNVLTLLRDDLVRRLGVKAQNLPWLNHSIEREQHGHTRAQTSTD
jgi:hypothetical protein